MVTHWKYTEPNDRVNVDRFIKICAFCHHYRDCISRKTYCPPYSLAVRWNAPTHTQELILKEIQEAKEKGWRMEDFCKICNWYCRIKSIVLLNKAKNPFLDMNYKYNKEPCAAFKFVMENIPCPVRFKPPS